MLSLLMAGLEAFVYCAILVKSGDISLVLKLFSLEMLVKFSGVEKEN